MQVNLLYSDTSTLEVIQITEECALKVCINVINDYAVLAHKHSLISITSFNPLFLLIKLFSFIRNFL